MYSFLLTDISYGVLVIMALILVLLHVFIWNSAAKDHYDVIGGKTLLTVMTGAAFTFLVCMGYGFAQEMAAKQVQPKDVYTITKTGKLITFDEKADNWKLKNKVTAKIVSETKGQYQVEVDGSFYNMSKSDVE